MAYRVSWSFNKIIKTIDLIKSYLLSGRSFSHAGHQDFSGYCYAWRLEDDESMYSSCDDWIGHQQVQWLHTITTPLHNTLLTKLWSLSLLKYTFHFTPLVITLKSNKK